MDNFDLNKYLYNNPLLLNEIKINNPVEVFKKLQKDEELDEIKVNNPNISSEQLSDLWYEIWNQIETFFYDDNQEIMLNLDKRFSELVNKYYKKYDEEIIDYLNKEEADILNQGERNQLYNDLTNFKKLLDKKQGIKEVKSRIKKIVKEISMTGGGEAYNTPFAFKKTKKKK